MLALGCAAAAAAGVRYARHKDRRHDLTSVAFFFIKPGAVNAKVERLVKDQLDSFGIEVLGEGNLQGAELDAIVDLHYGTLAARAMTTPPSELPALSGEVKTAFQTAFGVSWEKAVESGRVKNFTQAVRDNVFAPGASAQDVETAWRAGECVKLFPGTYVAHIDGTDAFVINGFYPSMRDVFLRAASGVSWKLVGWSAASRCKSWEQFRTGVVGATNPVKASPDSLRGKLYANYASYGLQDPPMGAQNGFHASASPLEALCERAIWTRAPHTPSGCSLKFPTRYEPLRTQLEKYGLATSSNFQLLSSNPTFLGDAVPIFDIVEHKDTAEVAMLLADRLQRLAKKQ